MGDAGFFILLAVATIVSFSVSEALNARRRARRRALIDSRAPESDDVFAAGVSALAPVPQSFARAFRYAVGRALGVDASRLQPGDRIARDLHAVNFDAWELSAVLERTFDMRVRVLDVVRAGTLRELCKLLHQRSEEVSEAQPPLHRDPVPKVRAPEPEVVHEVEAREVPPAPAASDERHDASV
ncbi:MAG: hypothetical protein KF696_16335 [Planctomycetes bacterium]|nr:hypothetical protein [Planctomycetota bacterium]MCW8136949.1 hypothetical protein [Planctomycetota bacterium]